MTRNITTLVTISVLMSSISNAMEHEVSEVLGRKMQNRAKQVFEFCDKNRDHVLSLTEQADADAKAHKILEGMSKEREIGRNRVPPSMDEPLYEDPDRITVDEFVQHFQAMGSIADAHARAMHVSQSKMVTFQAPIVVPVIAPAPQRSPAVLLTPYPVFIEEPHHHHLNNGGQAPQQSTPVYTPPIVMEHHQMESHHHHEQHGVQSHSALRK